MLLYRAFRNIKNTINARRYQYNGPPQGIKTGAKVINIQYKKSGMCMRNMS